MPRLAPLLRLFLVLAVALVSAHTAAGRALVRGAVAVELCRDGRFVTVTLDAEGNPVRHDHACPDCVLAGLAVAALPPSLAPPDAAAARLDAPAPRVQVPPLRLPGPLARGPPAGPLA